MLRIYKSNEIGTYGVIYRLSSPSGKVYIGQSWNVNNRFGKYRFLSTQIKNQPRLWNALTKYRPENFIYEIIDLCETQEEMNAKETYYIEIHDSLNKGYNSTSGGGINFRMSEEAKERISKARKKYFETHENNRKGKTHTEEAKRKISETKKHLFSTGQRIHNMVGIKVPKDLIEKRRLSNLKNGRYKYYKITLTSNVTVIISRLKQFCIDNGLCANKIKHFISNGGNVRYNPIVNAEHLTYEQAHDTKLKHLFVDKYN